MISRILQASYRCLANVSKVSKRRMHNVLRRSLNLVSCRHLRGVCKTSLREDENQRLMRTHMHFVVDPNPTLTLACLLWSTKHRQDVLPMSGELRSIGCIGRDGHGRRCNKSYKGLCNLGSTHPCRRSIEKCLNKVYGAEVRKSPRRWIESAGRCQETMKGSYRNVACR